MPGRTPLRLATVMAALLVSSGCESSVETEISVRKDGAAAVEVHVVFKGDIAETLEQDDALREQLEQTLRTSAGDVAVEVPARSYVIRPTLSELEAAAGMTGVGRVDVMREQDVVRVAVVTVLPEKLDASIRAAVSGQVDAEQLYATMAGNTYLEVRVGFPGEVTETNGGVIDGRSVRYRDTLSNWKSGTLVVSGEAEGGSSLLVEVIPVAVAPVAVAVLFVLAWRRRRK